MISATKFAIFIIATDEQSWLVNSVNFRDVVNRKRSQMKMITYLVLRMKPELTFLLPFNHLFIHSFNK